MKTLISDNNGYKIFAQVTKLSQPDNLTQVRFSTQWDNAKNPEEFQVKCEMFLDNEALARLKAVL